MEQTKWDDTLGRIGREIAKAYEGEQSDEDALVAIDDLLAAQTGGVPGDSSVSARELEVARHARSPPDDDLNGELLMDGQEEVFSRTEVERGVIEHHSLEEDKAPTGHDPDHAPDPEQPDGGPAGGAD